MTLGDLHQYVAAAELDELALMPWPHRPDLDAIEPGVLDQCRKNYPSVALEDLISRSVWVLLYRRFGEVREQ